MANLNDAYRTVQETIDRNNAAREEDGGVFQSVLKNIYTDLEGDLDPANIRNPLSIYGAALDSITGFRQKQIERAADAEVAFQTAVYTANRPLEKLKRADNLEANLQAQQIERQQNANYDVQTILGTLQGNDETKDFITSLVGNKPSSFASIEAAFKANHGFKVYGKDEEAPIEAGQLLHTSPDGRKLYASGDKQFINLNYHHDRLGKDFRKAIEAIGSPDLTVEKILQSSPEEKLKHFDNTDFRKAMEQTVGGIPPQILESHELYEKALTEKMGDINKSLAARTSFLGQQIKLAYARREAALKFSEARSGDREANDAFKAAHNEYVGLTEKQTELLLDGNFKRKVRSVVFKKAFALSLLSGLKSNPQSAERNIGIAMALSKNDPELLAYKKELEIYYNTTRDKLRAGTISPPQDTVGTREHDLQSGIPATRATGLTQKLEDNEEYTGP